MTNELVSASLAMLDEAVREHQPSAVFAMFSGGHDSLVATHVASQHPRFTSAVHINTGIGIEETRDFVRETCKWMGWPLIELHPTGTTYDELVVRYGFPGPRQHTIMYSYLKERAVRRLVREHKRRPGDRVMLVTGVRRQESRRRMGYVEPVIRRGAQVWVAPLADWSRRDVEDYIDAHGLERNPVAVNLHMSGECLCGAMAHRGEFHEIEFFYPQAAARIRALAERIPPGKPRQWGHGNGNHMDQLVMPFMPLCWGCEGRREEASA